MTHPHIPIRPGAIVRLANGQPAYTRNLRVRQSDIDHYGSYAAAKAAVQGRG
jgi:hypothetical protein